jgi:hypothetical protein
METNDRTSAGEANGRDDLMGKSLRLRYRRPDNQWKCGPSTSGHGCNQGPNGYGRCPERACQPRRTLRWWRSYLPIACAAMTLGAIIVMNFTGRDRNVIAPGPLTSAHAQLIHNPNDPHRCASCHDLADSPASTLNVISIAAHSQTERCMKCHVNTLPRMKLASPHDLPKEELEQLSQWARSKKTQTEKNWLVSLTHSQPIDWHQHELACSDCHREHQGSKHDLELISSQRCQACHQNPFGAFAKDHPEFTDYPAVRRQSVAFDHRRHSELHFTKSNASFDCRLCHVNEAESGRVGQVFRSTSFEKACASCHQKPIESSLPDGLIVFQLPSVDADGLKSIGRNIGPWPSEAAQLFDGRVPSFMQLLLASQPETQGLITALPDSGSLADIKLDRLQDVDALGKLVVATKQLLSELAEGGQPAFQARLKNLLGAETNEPLIAELIHGIPPDLFRQAYRDWFDVENFDRDSKNPPQNQFSPFALSSPLAHSDGRGAGGEGLLSSGTTPKSTKLTTIVASPSALSDSDLLPSGNDSLLDSQLTSTSPNSLAIPDVGPNSAWKDLRSYQHLPAGGWMIDRQRMAIVYIPKGHGDRWLAAYLSLGHAIAKQRSQSPIQSIASAPMDALVDCIQQECFRPNSLGRCYECHQTLSDFSVKTDSNTLWQAKRFDARVRELTRFDHGPHLLQPGMRDCIACHQMKDAKIETQPDERFFISTARTPDEHARPKNWRSDFKSLERQDCINCHRPNAAGDHCTQCHNYHTNAVD